jgi:hypothetical protein
MKIVIEGLPKLFATGGKVYKNLKPYPGDKYGAKKAGTPGSNASKMTEKELNDLAEQVGYDGPDDVKSFQQYLLSPEVRQKFPEIGKKIDELHTTYGMPAAGVPAEGNWGYRWDVFKDLKKQTPPKFEQEVPKEQPPVQVPQDQYREYYLNQPAQKPMYDKQGLPLYQVAPDLLGYASSLNTYPYYTPDYTHWEIAPSTLNIQPQLEDIDAATAAYYQTTTGNPALDSARRQATYAEGLKAKQNAFGRKQNYDAQAKYMADQYNIAARTQEQNLDTAATERVYNQYRAFAKDYADTQRNMILQDIAKKQGLNAANEAAKELYMNNFFPNVSYDANGNMLNITGGSNMFNVRYPYGTAPAPKSVYSEPSDIIPLATSPATVMTTPLEDQNLQIVPISKKATLGPSLKPTGLSPLPVNINPPNNLQLVPPSYVNFPIVTPQEDPYSIENMNLYNQNPTINEDGGMIRMKPIKGNKYKLPY